MIVPFENTFHFYELLQNYQIHKIFYRYSSPKIQVDTVFLTHVLLFIFQSKSFIGLILGDSFSYICILIGLIFDLISWDTLVNTTFQCYNYCILCKIINSAFSRHWHRLSQHTSDLLGNPHFSVESSAVRYFPKLPSWSTKTGITWSIWLQSLSYCYYSTSYKRLLVRILLFQYGLVSEFRLFCSYKIFQPE